MSNKLYARARPKYPGISIPMAELTALHKTVMELRQAVETLIRENEELATLREMIERQGERIKKLGG